MNAPCCQSHAVVPVEVRDVRVAFDGQPVLRGVTFQIPHGKVVALIVPNGSGKTTLAFAVLRLLPIEGQIRFGGASISRDAS